MNVYEVLSYRDQQEGGGEEKKILRDEEDGSTLNTYI
jgi:hypothetical protein